MPVISYLKILMILLMVLKPKQMEATTPELNKITGAIMKLIGHLDDVINHPRPITNNDSNRDKILDSFNKIYKWCRSFDDSAINHMGNVFKSQINWYDQAESFKFKANNSDTKKEKEDAIFFDIFELIETKFHNQFMDYLMDYDGCNTDTIDRFIGNIIDNKNYQDMIDLINSFTSLTSGVKKNDIQNIFGIIASQLQRKANTFLTCDDIPAYEQFYNLYERVLATTTKAYTMLICTFKFRQLRLFNFSLFEREQHITLESFKSSLKEITKSAKYYLETIDYPIYKSYKNCDPDSWSEGENYIRIKNYVTYYDSKLTWSDHFTTVNLSDVSQEYECNTVRAFWNPNDVQGIVYSMPCPYIYEDNYAKNEFCPSASNKYILPEHTHMKSSCINDKNNKLKRLCACEQSSDVWDSVRTLSLRQYMTNSDLGQVIVGVRFKVKNNIIHLEIKQGTLVNGTVDPQTVFWNTSFGFADEPPDTIDLTYEIKTFNFDTVEVPNGYFVTGIKFQVLSNNHLTIVVRGSKMYDDDRVFISTHDQWYYPPPENPDNARHNIKLEDLKNPAEAPFKNVELSKSGQHFTRLTPGVFSRRFNNVAVIPLIDSRAIVSSPPAPFGGLGLIYKGQTGYGGFIALKYILSKYNLNVDERVLTIN